MAEPEIDARIDILPGETLWDDGWRAKRFGGDAMAHMGEITEQVALPIDVVELDIPEFENENIVRGWD